METFRLITHIISTVGMSFFGIVMIAAGILNIKRPFCDKYFSIIAISDGVVVIGLVISQWF